MILFFFQIPNGGDFFRVTKQPFIFWGRFSLKGSVFQHFPSPKDDFVGCRYDLWLFSSVQLQWQGATGVSFFPGFLHRRGVGFTGWKRRVGIRIKIHV